MSKDQFSTVERFLQRLRVAREDQDILAEDLAREFVIGPGWIEGIESGRIVPHFEMFLALVERLKVGLGPSFEGVFEGDVKDVSELSRNIRAEENGSTIDIIFDYGKHDAVFTLHNATEEQFDEVQKVMRDGLSRLTLPGAAGDDPQVKTNAVRDTFLKAMELWPHACPSDVWWFIVYRLFCDPYNHPAAFARLALDQSWKRTAGWALEKIAVEHYQDELAKHGITMEIAYGQRKFDLAKQLRADDRIEADKIDVFLSGPDDQVFGVVHVKASFAERRSDDVPMSRALVEAGYFSPLWTMDCKSTPSERPVNKGELGAAEGNKVSAKRKDFEENGYFSACFSYNQNTIPSPDPEAVVAPVIVCDFSDPDDAFVEHTVAAWEKFKLHRE